MSWDDPFKPVESVSKTESSNSESNHFSAVSNGTPSRESSWAYSTGSENKQNSWAYSSGNETSPSSNYSSYYSPSSQENSSVFSPMYGTSPTGQASNWAFSTGSPNHGNQNSYHAFSHSDHYGFGRENSLSFLKAQHDDFKSDWDAYDNINTHIERSSWAYSSGDSANHSGSSGDSGFSPFTPQDLKKW